MTIRCSRNGCTSPLGKLAASVPGFRVEPSVKEKFDAHAAALGKPASELLRDIYRIVALGADEVKRVHAGSIDAVSGMLVGMQDK